VRADARVDVEYFDALPRGELAAQLLVVGVGDVLGGGDAVESEERLSGVCHTLARVMFIEIINDVRAAEVPRRPHVELEPDRRAGVDFVIRVSGYYFLDKSARH